MHWGLWLWPKPSHQLLVACKYLLRHSGVVELVCSSPGKPGVILLSNGNYKWLHTCWVTLACRQPLALSKLPLPAWLSGQRATGNLMRAGWQMSVLAAENWTQSWICRNIKTQSRADIKPVSQENSSGKKGWTWKYKEGELQFVWWCSSLFCRFLARRGRGSTNPEKCLSVVPVIL